MIKCEWESPGLDATLKYGSYSQNGNTITATQTYNDHNAWSKKCACTKGGEITKCVNGSRFIGGKYSDTTCVRTSVITCLDDTFTFDRLSPNKYKIICRKDVISQTPVCPAGTKSVEWSTEDGYKIPKNQPVNWDTINQEIDAYRTDKYLMWLGIGSPECELGISEKKVGVYTGATFIAASGWKTTKSSLCQYNLSWFFPIESYKNPHSGICALEGTNPCPENTILAEEISINPHYEYWVGEIVSGMNSCPLPDDDGDNIPNELDKENTPPLKYVDKDGIALPEKWQDDDRDGVNNPSDNCPYVANPGQEDTDKDGDGIADACDNCISVANPNQTNSDADSLGDACDNCPSVANSGQEDRDKDGIADACDNDIDNDGILNSRDNCNFVKNPGQEDYDKDGIGDACDNCVLVSNPGQEDTDYSGKDWIGDACDNCPLDWNNNQKDTDKDGIGDACDKNDDDSDGVLNADDNCPNVYNPEQRTDPATEDSDKDGIGDACDNDWDNDGILNSNDSCPNVYNPEQTWFQALFHCATF